MASVDGEVSTAKEIKAWVPQDFVLFATAYVPLKTRYLYIRSMPPTAKTVVF
jgi:hypothetical protein